MRARRLVTTTPNETLGLDKLGLGVLLYGYAILLGACYLFAFWRPFGFNIFPYLKPQDYVSAPLNRFFVLIGPPVVFAAIVFGGERMKDHSTYRNLLSYFTITYAVIFSIEIWRSISRYLNYNFRFDNETTVIILSITLFLVGSFTAYVAYKSAEGIAMRVAALILVQASVSVSSGYLDGKVLFNGALQVHLLGNREICEPESVHEWVYLGVFGEKTFFMNATDKRLCLTGEKNIRLVSRQFKDAR